MPTKSEKINTVPRSPVVAVLGHIDHGKSTLLDYIRKSNIVEGEAGGITQQIAAYEITHKDENGQDKRITFLDTPGHSAFSDMRIRGATAADIAILVVSAEDGVMPQTLEAWKAISESKTPAIVAINKIDKPNANVEKTKNDLTENAIYIEGYGGEIPAVEISAKNGTGVDHLLDIILLISEMGGLTGNKEATASGIVIESNLDIKRGISASLLIKDGTLTKGMFVVAKDSFTTTRILENFKGEPIDKATFSSPIRITGFSKLPVVGSEFTSYYKKSDAEEATRNALLSNKHEVSGSSTKISEQMKVVPIILKTDTEGTREAIEKEIAKLNGDTIVTKIIGRGVGAISENDIKLASSDRESIILGFNVKVDQSAQNGNENLNLKIETFNVIYKLTEWLADEIEKRRPRITAAKTTGSLKIIRCFSQTKERQVVGGKVTEGSILAGANVKILRRENEIGQGRIIELQHAKIKVGEVTEGNECGMLVESKIEIAPGDVLQAFTMVTE